MAVAVEVEYNLSGLVEERGARLKIDLGSGVFGGIITCTSRTYSTKASTEHVHVRNGQLMVGGRVDDGRSDEQNPWIPVHTLSFPPR